MSVFTFSDLAFMGAVGGVPWTPANITTALWLDANDSATVIESGGAITTWNDKSGNGHNATADGNPTYSATGMSTSKPAAQLDGTGDGFVSSITGIGSFSALDVYMVMQTAAAAAANTNSGNFWGYGNISGAGGGYPANKGLVLASSTGNHPNETITLFPQPGLPVAIASSTYARAANTAQILNGKCSTSGTSLFANGQAVTLDLVDFGITTSTNTAPSVLSYTNDTDFRIGSFRVAGNLVYSPAIKFAEVIVSSTLLSTDNRQRAEGYLAHKWGLTASLPNDHPYKSAAPTV